MNTVSPEEVGISSERLERVSKLMRSYTDSGKLPGIVSLLSRKGKTFHFEKFGVADLDSQKPMELDTMFRIYSMTKPITSVAVMMLYEEGNFGLDDPISNFIPQLGNMKVCEGMGESGPKFVDQKSPITIRQLLSHSAGLTYGNRQDSPAEAMYKEASLGNPDHTLQEMVEKLGELPLVYHPGTSWRYSVATDVLSYLVEVVSGQPFDVFLKENILGPLGMVDTDFYAPEEKLDRLASVYGPAKDGGIEKLDNASVNAGTRPHKYLSGGGGLVSTASDYLNFCTMMLNGGNLNGTRLLSPKTVELMTSNHLTEAQMPFAISENMADFTKGCGFGLGFKVITDVVQQGILGSEGNYSWGGAASTVFWIDPKEQLIAIFLTQFMPSSHYAAIRRQLPIAAYQAMID